MLLEYCQRWRSIARLRVVYLVHLPHLMAVPFSHQELFLSLRGRHRVLLRKVDRFLVEELWDMLLLS